MISLTITLILLASNGLVTSIKVIPECMIDMTHYFDNDTLFFPILVPFVQSPRTKPLQGWDSPIRVDDLVGSSNDGTHVDAPYHLSTHGTTVDNIPLEQLVNVNVIVVDVTKKAEKDRDYGLSVDDLIAWERKYRKRIDNTVVFMKSGWQKYWPDRNAYTGTPELDSEKMHFPGFSEEAAKFLMHQRKVIGVGVDTLSMDPGARVLLPAHRVFLGTNHWGLENVANMEKLPPHGAKLIVLPLKLRNGSGGFARIVAYFPKSLTGEC